MKFIINRKKLKNKPKKYFGSLEFKNSLRPSSSPPLNLGVAEQWLKRKIQKMIRRDATFVCIMICCVTGLVVTVQETGVLQVPEWAILDQLFHFRPSEPIDPRIVVVQVDEPDISKVGQWPIPDEVLSQLIEKIKLQKPRVIGLDIYRNIPVEPGAPKLRQTFESTPNLIGVEKLLGSTVASSPILAQHKQIAFSDLKPDTDGKVRRGLISVMLPNQQEVLGFATRIALEYLATEKITPQPVDNTSQVKIGKATLNPFLANDGGYIKANDKGYQVLLNFRGSSKQFYTVSMTEVLEGRVPLNLLNDRIVLIGSTAESIRDFFQTPFSITPGIIVHANLISQIVGAALDGRLLMQGMPPSLKWLWIMFWACIGTSISWKLLKTNLDGRIISPYWIVVGIVVSGGVLLLSSYLAFLAGWWMPIISPFLALAMGSICSTSYYTQKLQRLTCTDSLTQVANRLYFDKFLRRHAKVGDNLAFILCDVDYFKIYNDTYGHQAGDVCLQKVAGAICQAVRKSDLVARYGGEEFAVILPDTNVETAMQVATKILEQVRGLQLSHSNSKIAEHVTLSCGVASMVVIPDFLPADLILIADKALYSAKNSGRDRAIAV